MDVHSQMHKLIATSFGASNCLEPKEIFIEQKT
jgi:hypothetical protein